MKGMIIVNYDIKDIMASLGINNADFWNFLEGRTKRLPLLVNEFGWGCFPVYDNNILRDIRVLVPEIINEETLLVNIHEFAHAYLLYLNLGKRYALIDEEITASENYARAKEAEYLKLK